MGRTMCYEGEMGCWTALRILAYQPGSLTGRCPMDDALVSFQALLIIRHVHCETQHYLTALFTHTPYPFFTSARTITLDLEKASQSTLWLCSLGEKTVPKSLRLQEADFYHQVIHQHSWRSLPKSFRGRVSPSYLSALIGFQFLKTGGSSPLPPLSSS